MKLPSAMDAINLNTTCQDHPKLHNVMHVHYIKSQLQWKNHPTFLLDQKILVTYTIPILLILDFET